MIITFENQEDINSLYLHDNIYHGFVFDYKKRAVRMLCENHQEHKRFVLTFRQVVALQAQNCCFWGPSNHIYDIWIDENPRCYESLLQAQAENAGKYGFSNLDSGISYLSIVLQLISGDDIRITCEIIEIEESDFGLSEECHILL